MLGNNDYTVIQVSSRSISRSWCKCMSASPDNRSSDIRHSMASAPPVQLQLLIFSFTGFDWLMERRYRPSCRQSCPPAEKVETITCFSICAHRSPLAREILLSKQRRTDHRTDPPPPPPAPPPIKNSWIRHCLESFELHYFFLMSNTHDENSTVREHKSTVAHRGHTANKKVAAN